DADQAAVTVRALLPAAPLLSSPRKRGPIRRAFSMVLMAMGPGSRFARPGRQQPHHSALMPANLITLPHFSVSSAMSLLKSAGEQAIAVPPRSAIRALILGFTSAALISMLSLLMISGGVFLGAPMPK